MKKILPPPMLKADSATLTFYAGQRRQNGRELPELGGEEDCSRCSGSRKASRDGPEGRGVVTREQV